MYNSLAGLRFVKLLLLDFQSQFGGGKKKQLLTTSVSSASGSSLPQEPLSVAE